jgi:esterase
VLHGIFGAGRNWRSVARRVVAARPDWSVVLADLRMHGASQDMPPPHTLAAAAADVAGLAETDGPPAAAVLGHSFGGKVALVYLAARPRGLRQVWIVDADPSAGPPRGAAWEMLRVVEALPPEFRTRLELVDALERAGIDRRTGEWMAGNLEVADGAYRWRLDVGAMRDLMRDFFAADLWTVVEDPPPGVDLRVLLAGRASAVSAASAARLEAAAQRTGRLRLARIEGGHWLNADNPDGVVAALAAGLPAA